MSDYRKEINEKQLQEILKVMSEMSKRKSPKKKPLKKSGDSTSTDS